MIDSKILIVILVSIIIVMGIAIVALGCVIISKNKTKSDYDKRIEDDEQMVYLKKK